MAEATPLVLLGYYIEGDRRRLASVAALERGGVRRWARRVLNWEAEDGEGLLRAGAQANVEEVWAARGARGGARQ